MWEKTLLLLHSVQAVMASQCWQGATFSEAVVSPAVESSGILRVPGVASLPQCVAACCDLPGYDLAWLFEGRCYILNCQQRENCQPRERPGADSVLAFLRRASPQTLVLQSLVRGEPYGGRWRPLSRSSEAPGDLLEMTTDRPSLKGGDGFNQSEAEGGPERTLTGSSVAQNRATSGGNISQEDEDETRRPTDPAAAEKTTRTGSSTDSSSLTLQKPTTDSARHDHRWTSLPTRATTRRPISTSIQTGTPEAVLLQMFQSAAPPTNTDPPARDVTADPLTTSITSTSSVSTSPPTTPSAPPSAPPSAAPGRYMSTVIVCVCADVQPHGLCPSSVSPPSGSEGRGSNRGPVAVVGPDRKLFLPVSSLLLDGGGSTDDRGIVSYHWDAISGPPGLKLEGADQAVATATGLRVGRYTFRLTVSDQEGASDSASLTARVQEARSLPPVAHASGSHTLTLPNNSLVLRGSVTDGDQTEVHYAWVRDSQSPAAGEVLYGSDTQASLYLSNLVEGTYLFQLRVTDAQGRSSAAMATVEVRPEPGGGEEVELEMLVSVSQVSMAQRDTVVRQLAALFHVLDSDIQVRALQGHSHLSTVLRFSVQGPSGPVSGSRLVGLLRNQLLREKSDYLLFRVLRVDTVLCLLRCSGRGQCDPITKECTCDPFWTENLIRRYLGDGESNCEWRVLYVILTSFVLMVFILSVSWTFICCCKRRRQTKMRKKTKYTILDNMDEQERVELRPKFSIKHRSTEHNSSLMMSESELDSDQDTIFSRDRPVRSRNRISAQAARNGNAFG
ncbi:Dyslexia-associated protein KIAA0319 [Collichthys lucidus]|uniref:Dyslexia-associated protein KIAA0319 n=1 Tax=Collichthys lucidus TaxID=240159 RepID=A0A4U5V5Z8_COLLU|nr:Dyslexia-associated protein KIAA0319 [Collichthys lucidus]